MWPATEGETPGVNIRAARLEKQITYVVVPVRSIDLVDRPCLKEEQLNTR